MPLFELMANLAYIRPIMMEYKTRSGFFRGPGSKLFLLLAAHFLLSGGDVAYASGPQQPSSHEENGPVPQTEKTVAPAGQDEEIEESRPWYKQVLDLIGRVCCFLAGAGALLWSCLKISEAAARPAKQEEDVPRIHLSHLEPNAPEEDEDTSSSAAQHSQPAAQIAAPDVAKQQTARDYLTGVEKAVKAASDRMEASQAEDREVQKWQQIIELYQEAMDITRKRILAHDQGALKQEWQDVRGTIAGHLRHASRCLETIRTLQTAATQAERTLREALSQATQEQSPPARKVAISEAISVYKRSLESKIYLYSSVCADAVPFLNRMKAKALAGLEEAPEEEEAPETPQG